MKIQHTKIDDLLVIELVSEEIISSNADEIKSSIINLILQGEEQLIIDLSNVKFIDSRGLGMFISISKNVEPDGSMVLCALSSNVMQVFELTRLTKIFSIYKDTPSAINALKK